MSRSFDKLVALLKELFQLDRPDLDFGFYRIMHAKSAEVTQFLKRDLLPQVQAALSQYQSADKVAIEKEFNETIRRIRSDGADPDTSPKVRDLRARLAEEAVDLDALEAEVYDHLYGFFRLYYSEGDFLGKRVYKPGAYTRFPTRARRSGSTGPTRTSTTSRPASTCAITPSDRRPPGGRASSSTSGSPGTAGLRTKTAGTIWSTSTATTTSRTSRPRPTPGRYASSRKPSIG